MGKDNYKNDTIRKVERKIVTILDCWLSTITDVDLRERIKDNLILSGNSISQMINNEYSNNVASIVAINDYDIFFRDREIVKDYINYYISKNENCKSCPRGFLIIKELEITKDLEEIDSFETFTCSGCENYTVNNICCLSKNAITLFNNIQLIFKFSHSTPEELIKTFDFSYLLSYFTFADGIVLSAETFGEIRRRYVNYLKSDYPVRSLRRAIKLSKKNYDVRWPVFLRILEDIRKLDEDEYSKTKMELYYE